MSEDQQVTLKDVKRAVDYNTSMMEMLVPIVQTLQNQNLKIEKKLGDLESDLTSLRSNMAGLCKEPSLVQTKQATSQNHIDKEVLTRSLTEVSVDVKSFVKDEAADIKQGSQTFYDNNKANMARMEKQMVTKLDALAKAQTKTCLKVEALSKDVQTLKASDADVNLKLSGLIRVSAHGNIKLYQELTSLSAAADTSTANLSSDIKTQTKALKSSQRHMKEDLSYDLGELKALAEDVSRELSGNNPDHECPASRESMRDELMHGVEALGDKLKTIRDDKKAEQESRESIRDELKQGLQALRGDTAGQHRELKKEMHSVLGELQSLRGAHAHARQDSEPKGELQAIHEGLQSLAVKGGAACKAVNNLMTLKTLLQK